MEVYPLDWPVGYSVTPSEKRLRSKFITTADKSQRFLRDEIRRLGGRDLIVSTNILVKKDGNMYADYMNRRIDEPGVAIFFRYNGMDITMCCDQYLTVWENVCALAKGIEAIRGMERWGVSDFIKRAFTGFTALPPGNGMVTASQARPKRDWWIVLYVTRDAPEEIVKASYRQLALKYHPDKQETADAAVFREVSDAWEEAKKQNGWV